MRIVLAKILTLSINEDLYCLVETTCLNNQSVETLAEHTFIKEKAYRTTIITDVPVSSAMTSRRRRPAERRPRPREQPPPCWGWCPGWGTGCPSTGSRCAAPTPSCCTPSRGPASPTTLCLDTPWPMPPPSPLPLGPKWTREGETAAQLVITSRASSGLCCC